LKKLIFVFLMTLMCLGSFGQTDEETMEIIPTVSASGNGSGLSLDSELIIAKKFTLTKNNKWFLYGQLGAMYNVYKFKFSDEWQLGLEPMVGIGTKHFRLNGFLNGLAVKAPDTGKMPFVEGGARFSLTPWSNVWISLFGTWPISDPVYVMPLEDTYFETDEGVFLVGIDKWARQVNSYGFDIDFGFAEKFIANLDGFKIEGNNYQVGAGIQYHLFKNKPWIIGGNVYYTNFENEDWYYIHNIFPGMFGNDIEGYTFKFGISNFGGLGEANFSQKLNRIAEPMYFSPVVWEKKESTPTKINSPFKVDCCNIGSPQCLYFTGAICISGGLPPYRIFVDWGDGTTTQYTVEVAGNFPISHSYLQAAEYIIMISGLDKKDKTSRPCGNKIVTKDCGDSSECEDVTMKFDVSQNKIKKLETVYFNWSVEGADQVTFDGKDVATVVPKYPVIFNETGKFTYVLKAWNKGKVCLEKAIVITVVDCNLPIVELFTVDPLKIIGKGSVLVTWTTSGADIVTLNGQVVAAQGNQTFEITSPTDFNLLAKNKCDEVEKTLHVDFIPCILCNDIYFHDGSSQTDNFTSLPCGGSLHIPYTIYNESECEYDVLIKWQIFMDTDTSVPTYSGSYTVHVPANAHPLNLFFDFTPPGATAQCCYKKVTLKIGACTN